MLADVMREMGFRKAEEFYVALGRGKISPKTTANKLMQRLRAGEVIDPEPPESESVTKRDRQAKAREASEFGITVDGVDNVALRLAKCCLPVPGDEIIGYVSLGRGITIHRSDCRNVADLKASPERVVEVSWEGENEATFRVELQIDAYDRTRLLEDLAKTFAEAGINIISATCATNPPMVKNTFVVEVGDTAQLKNCINRSAQRRVGLRRPPDDAEQLTEPVSDRAHLVFQGLLPVDSLVDLEHGVDARDACGERNRVEVGGEREDVVDVAFQRGTHRVHLVPDLVLSFESALDFGKNVTDRGPFASDRQHGDVCGGHRRILPGPGKHPQAMIERDFGAALRVICS